MLSATNCASCNCGKADPVKARVWSINLENKTTSTITG